MAINVQTIIGSNLACAVLQGETPPALTDWTSYKLTLSDATDDAMGADQTIDQVVAVSEKLEVELAGFQGIANNAGVLPQKGDLIVPTLTQNSTTVIPDISRFLSTLRVTEAVYDFKKGPNTFSLKARSGVQNRLFGTDPD